MHPRHDAHGELHANYRLSSGFYDYDQTDDVVANLPNQYFYDAEGRICAVASNNGHRFWASPIATEAAT